MKQPIDDLQKALLHLARTLVKNPNDVTIDVLVEAEEVILKLSVNPADLGQVIGKGGRTVKAIRLLVLAAAQNAGHRISFDIVAA